MKRDITGRYVVQTTQGESVRAFVPNPLPPAPPIQWTPGLLAAQQRAALALGRLDGVTALLPDPALFLYSYVRKEAVLSSQIEGTQSSLSDLLAYENRRAPGIPLDDVVEVTNYVAALDHGLKRLKEGFPLCLRLIREIHEVLLTSEPVPKPPRAATTPGGGHPAASDSNHVDPLCSSRLSGGTPPGAPSAAHGGFGMGSRSRGSGKQPGEFRTSQNWIGGSRPGNAKFVPPPHEELPECLKTWETFLHGNSTIADPLTRAALAHVQFETLHPFLDGNGRVGRLLITLLLHAEGVLREPLLYLSLFLKQHRETYYELLQKVRIKGDWEAWLDFFFQGVTETSDSAVSTVQRLLQLFAEDRKRIQANGKIAGSVLQVHHYLQGRPIASASAIGDAENLSPATVNKALKTLVELGIVREITGGQRNRLFAYGQVLQVLSEGMEL